MGQDLPENLTALLRRGGSGDCVAANEAMSALYPELVRVARMLMSGQRIGHTLDPDGLVNEGYLKIAAAAKSDWNDRGHFLATMSRAMRQCLIDQARRKQRAKHGGGWDRVPLTGILLRFEDLAIDLMALHEAIDALRELDPVATDALEATHFAGLEAAEVAERSGRSTRSVQRDLKFARTWIRGKLTVED